MGMPVDLIQIDFTRAWDLFRRNHRRHGSRRAVNTIVQPVLFGEIRDQTSILYGYLHSSGNGASD